MDSRAGSPASWQAMRAQLLRCGGCSLVSKLCLTLRDPMDCSPPGSSVHGIFQARILEWVTIFFSRGSFRPRDRTCDSCIGRQILYHQATWGVHSGWYTELIQPHTRDGSETGQTSTSGEIEWDTGGGNGPRVCDILGFCQRWRKESFGTMELNGCYWRTMYALGKKKIVKDCNDY